MRTELEFEWDSVKAETNYRKHGIRFEEAALVFDDPFHLSAQDRIENGEFRWQTIGTVKGCVVVLVGVSLEIGNFCTLSALFNQSWFVRG